jgi:DNA polymerase-1
MPSRPRLFLIDGHALAYRTYFALTRASDTSRWMTKSGEPTAGTYGFASVLLRLLEQEAPDYIAVSFDIGRTFRDDLYPEYKATREKMPDDLRIQIDRIRELVATMGITILEAEGYEADDVLGTVAHQAAQQDITVIILTGDRDLLQLADENIVIQLAGQKLSEAINYGPADVKARYGIDPHQFVDYKALVGDKSDNIPGVRGIGEKTAADLLQNFGSLDGIYAHLDEIPTRFRNKLEAGCEEAYLSQKLSQIVTDAPVDFKLESCRATDYDRDQLVELFRVLEFRSLLNRLQPEPEAGPKRQMSLFVDENELAPRPHMTEVVDTPEALESLSRRLQDSEHIAFDVETTSTNAMRAELVGISLATDSGEGYYIPLGHRQDLAGGPQLEPEIVLSALRGPLTDAEKPKVGHNLKYDYIILARHDVRPFPLTFDTMLAEWLCDPASRNLGLKNLAWVRLGLEMTEITELIGQGREQRSMAEIPITKVAPYAVADAQVCLRMMPELMQELQEKGQWKLFQELEMPLVSILADMEMAGIQVDTDFLKELSQDLADRLSTIEEQIYQLAGNRRFNINSTQQLSKVLFDDLNLAPPAGTRRTTSGHYSTAASVLEEMRTAHPVVECILEQREIAKLKSTYADAFQTQVNPYTGRVHTSYNQTGSVTGRLASSDPNLQNIPIRTELGRQIRRAFVSSPGQVLLSVDYSQIELRVVAHMAEDKAMIEAFLEDQDIHTTTAAAVFEVPLQDVSPQLRRRAKAVNFGLIYGMSPFGLTRTTDLTLAEAENFVKAYFERFPGVKRYLDDTRRQAAEDGYVATLLGRRRYFPQLTRGASVSEQARARTLREAINAPIQGTAADIIKLAMLHLPRTLKDAGLGARMLLQVHDELVLECPEKEVEAAAQLVKKTMSEAFKLRVPLKTDAKVGRNWAELRAID